MKIFYPVIRVISPEALLSSLIVLAFVLFGEDSVAQSSGTVKVGTDRQLIDAIANPAVRTFIVEAGNYPSIERFIGNDATAVKPGNPNGSRDLSCTYLIQQSSTCFDPVPPETYVTDTARAFTIDFSGCECCPPNDAGVWSVILAPGNVIIQEPTEDTTAFSVDQAGVYILRYTWPAPWSSYVETFYYFYASYSGSLEGTDTCGLTTNVHFEYSSPSPDPATTLSWTLNGAPYAGPALDPNGDTLDFVLTVPSCGDWILEATITPSTCSPVTLSDTINLRGENPPVITGVGADTTVICPDPVVFSNPVATDPCGGEVVLTSETDSIPGNCPDHYTLVRTWTATNECSQSSTATQTIVHLPNPNPQIELIGINVEGDSIVAPCGENVTLPFPEIQTPCGEADVQYSRTDGGLWGDPFPTGTTIVCYWGISPCGYSTDTLCLTIIIEECEGDTQHCTLTQGFYGNPGGTFCNGMGTAELIEYLLSEGDLVVGSNGNTMTFTSGESDCIIDLLPGGGPSKTISGANTCASHPGIQIKKGRIYNVLLAQTITLGLNIRLDGDLGDLEIFSNTLMTAPSSGCDGEGDTLTGAYGQSTIPISVYNVLSQNGNIVPNVWDLFTLANTALGGGSISGTTLSAISDAMSRINEGFDECAFGYFMQASPSQSNAAVGSNTPDNTGGEDLKISPNPFSNIASIEFTASQDGHAVVEVYTLLGAKVATLFDGEVEKGSTHSFAFSGDPGLNQVTYICVIRTNHDTSFKRMVMMK